MHKYKILILSLLMIPFICFSQTEEKPKYAPGKEKHRNKTDEFGQKQGTWKTFNSYGEIMTEVEYLNDKRQGVSKRYYPYSKLMEEQEFQNGIKEGVYKRYYYSGTVKQEGEYIAGKKDGKWTRYFEDASCLAFRRKHLF